MARRRRSKKSVAKNRNQDRAPRARKPKKPLLDRRNFWGDEYMTLRNGTDVMYKPDYATMRIGERPVPDEQVAAEDYQGDWPGVVHYVPEHVPPHDPNIPVMAIHQPAITANPGGPPHVDYQSMYEQILAAQIGGHQIPIPLLLNGEPEQYMMVNVDDLLWFDGPVDPWLLQFVPPELREGWRVDDGQEVDRQEVRRQEEFDQEEFDQEEDDQEENRPEGNRFYGA